MWKFYLLHNNLKPAMLPSFAVPEDPSLLTYGIYDPTLVGLSLLVAIFSSWMGLQVTGQASAHPSHRAIALGTGSLALGAGVWSMHFIGMLAFDLCTPVHYDHWTTLLSALPSIGASWVALSLISRPELRLSHLLVGGVLVGAGIGAMHYAGMDGMRMRLSLHYDPFTFAVSILVAVILSTLALGVRHGLSRFQSVSESRRLLLSACVMGCAIAGMHYTGMAAARFVGHGRSGRRGQCQQRLPGAVDHRDHGGAVGGRAGREWPAALSPDVPGPVAQRSLDARPAHHHDRRRDHGRARRHHH